MGQIIKRSVIPFQEIIFQTILHFLVFIFYSFDRNHPQIHVYQVCFFINYACAAFFINYVLLPRFYYQKKYFIFFGIFVLTIASVILIEECVIEKIYFPNTRGKSFPGVVYSLLDVMPVISIFVGFKFAWDSLGKQRELDSLKEAIKDSELQFLKSQINPHFLFNNLNNLYSYAIEKSPKTPKIILELSDVLRYMLYECKEDLVPITKEVAQLQNFVNLSEMQIEERGHVDFTTLNILDGYQIAPLILIVFIENAFKHSTASQTDEIIIDIDLRLLNNGVLEFVCTNSFQSLSNNDQLSHGIGLENVRKRLDLLYPDAHQLDIKTSKNFYEVFLTIDLTKTV